MFPDAKSFLRRNLAVWSILCPPLPLQPRVPQLSRVAYRFIFTNVDVSGRKVFSPEELSGMVRGVPSVGVPDPVTAVEAALTFPQRVIVSGSLYLAGEVLAKFAPESAFDL